MSDQQCTRFRTTVDFDREYLWNGLSNRQVENGVINYDVLHVRRKHLGEFWSINEEMTSSFDYDLEIQKGSRGCQGTCSRRISSSKVQRFMSYLAHREKKLRRKQYCPSLPRTVITWATGLANYTKSDNGKQNVRKPSTSLKAGGAKALCCNCLVQVNVWFSSRG